MRVCGGGISLKNKEKLNKMIYINNLKISMIIFILRVLG